MRERFDLRLQGDFYNAINVANFTGLNTARVEAAVLIVKFNGRGRLMKSWKVPKNAASADERPLAVAATQDAENAVRALARPGSEGKLPRGCQIVTGDALDESLGLLDLRPMSANTR